MTACFCERDISGNTRRELHYIWYKQSLDWRMTWFRIWWSKFKVMVASHDFVCRGIETQGSSSSSSSVLTLLSLLGRNFVTAISHTVLVDQKDRNKTKGSILHPAKVSTAKKRRTWIVGALEAAESLSLNVCTKGGFSLFTQNKKALC